MIHPPQEQDLVPGRKIAGVGLGVVLATAIGALVAYGIESCRTRDLHTEGQAASGPPIAHDVNGMETRPFDVQAQGIETHVEAERVLRSYGWVDRARGTVHVPIDVAFDVYLQRQTGGAR